MVWIPKAEAPARAVVTSYQPTFITYLSRFLLNYDSSSANWWRDQLRSIPLSLERQQLTALRERQFGQFSESVEVGLQRYQGKAGVRALFSFLKSRYGSSPAAKLQLALLFSIISAKNQPSKLMRRALGQADNGVVTQVCILDGGRGYASTETPDVFVSSPDGSTPDGSIRPAVVRAELATTGQILRVALRSGGSGYLPGDSPVVKISPPPGFGGRPAQAIARVEGGEVVTLELIDRGRGYRARDVVAVTIDPPRNEAGVPVLFGAAASASVELESGVNRLILKDGGQGYARDQPMTISIAPPKCSGNVEDGRTATAKLEPLKYAFDLEALPSDGPFSDFYAEGTVSAELLRLLPSTVRPDRRPDGTFAFPLADPAALSEALDRNGGRSSGLDVNMESYKYAARQSSRQKLPFAADRDPTFGPLGTSPAQREASLTTADYLAFAASGAACTSLVRTALVPLDVAKTLMQSAPEAYPALRPAIASLWKQGGLPSLYRSIDVTAVAGLLLGGFGFGVNEFLRRYLGALGGPQAQAQYSLQIAIGAALGSVIAVCLVTTPFEVLRIRAIEAASFGNDAAEAEASARGVSGSSNVATPAAAPAAPVAAAAASTRSSSPEDLDEGARREEAVQLADAATVGRLERMWQSNVTSEDLEGCEDECMVFLAPPPLPASAYNMVNGLGTLYNEGGVATLYSGLTPLLLRELPFSITKFLVYDSATQAIAAAFPLAQEGPLASALLSLTGGLVAGVVAAAVSTPADTLLTLTQTPPPNADSEGGARAEPPTMFQLATDMATTNPLAFFNGLLPRCVFFGALIAGQFLLYDNFKQLFNVGSSDITFYLDVFASTDLSFFPQAQNMIP